MKFTLNTEPLSDSLNLGVINSNVSKFYQKSTLAQITATKTTFRVNLEAASILSEIQLKGSGDEDTESVAFVDCLVLKQLISTINTATVTFEFTDSGLIVYSGKSKFTLPEVVDSDLGIELDRPVDDNKVECKIALDKNIWKFVKDYQLYAISMSLIYPVYTKVYVGKDGEVLVGDFDNSLFTYSNKSNLDSTCLLTDTIINLFDSVPDGTNIYKSGKSYYMSTESDAYSFSAKFTPSYEDDEGVGTYNAPIILGLMSSEQDDTPVRIKVSDMNKVLNQAALLSTSTEDSITLKFDGSSLHVYDNNVDAVIEGNGQSIQYSVPFKTTILKSVISNAPEDDVAIYPLYTDGSINGVRFQFKELTVVLAGVEE